MKDAVALIGLCLIGAGLWWAYWPIAVVYGGTSLIGSMRLIKRAMVKGKAKKNADIERRIREADQILRRCQRSNIDPVKELKRACDRKERKSK